MITRRIIPRGQIGGLGVAKSTDPRRTCPRTITLDRKTYQCGRETYGADSCHEGIHDAFATHEDGGSVRW